MLVDGRLVQQRDHIALHYSQFSETMHQIREEEGMNMSAIVFFKNSIFFIYLESFSKKNNGWCMHLISMLSLNLMYSFGYLIVE